MFSFLASFGAVGVDLGTSAVQMLQLRTVGDGLRVLGASRIEAPDSAPEEEWTPTSEQILAAFSAGGFAGRRCVVSLPRGDVRVQAVRLPKMSERELEQAVAWEAAHRFKLDREAMEVDFIPTGAAVHGSDDREETLIVAVAHETLNRRLEPVLAAGLRPIAVDTDFAALARAVTWQARRDADRAEVRAVVEIGHSGSCVMILRGQNIAFHKQLSMRGAQLNRAVTERLQIDEQAARDLRRARILDAVEPAEAGTGLDASTDRAVYEAVRPQLNDLVKEVVLCLRYYGVTFRGHPPSMIQLAGGDSLEPNFQKLLQQSCKIPVVYDDARGTLRGLSGQIRPAMHRAPGPPPSWLVAAGLSLRGMLSRRLSRRPPAHPVVPSVREAAA